MSNIGNRGRLWPVMDRQMEQITTDHVNEERHAFEVRNGQPVRWEEHVEAWVHFSTTNPSIEISFIEWERIRRRDRWPNGKTIIRRS